MNNFVMQTIQDYGLDKQADGTAKLEAGSKVAPSEAQLSSKACYEKLLQISTQTMRMLEEALSVID